MKITILGQGVVGRAQNAFFAGHQLVTYDPAVNKNYPRTKIAGSDFAVVAVPTDQVVRAVSRLPRKLPVIVRSTVVPGTMAELRELDSDRKLVHIPEFLHEREGGKWSKVEDVPFLIVGGDGPSLWWARNLLTGRFPGKIWECSAAEAEMVKYVANLHWAVKVTFVNEMAELCQLAGVDWENVRDAWVQDTRVDLSYTRMKGFPPGFGGRCWPENLSILIDWAWRLNHAPGFLEDVEKANDRFRRGSGAAEESA